MKIMVADDEKWVRATVVQTIPFEKLGMNLVCEASNGLEALEKCRQHQPDILLTDIMMPGINGLELIAQLKQILPELKIIIISGYSDFDYVKTAIKYGVFDYILKPIDENEIFQILEKAKALIIKEREQLKEESSIRSGYNSVLQIIHEVFLNSLISPHSFNHNEIENELAKHKIEFSNPYFTILVFKPEKPISADESNKFIEIKLLLGKVLKKYLNSETFTKTENEYLMISIINHDNPKLSEADSFIRVINLCTNMFRKTFKRYLHVGVSSASKHMYELNTLYNEAVIAISTSFWEVNDYIFIFNNEMLKSNFSTEVTEDEFEEIALKIKIGDYQYAINFIDNIFKIKENFKNSKPEQVKEFFWVFLQSVTNRLNIQQSFIDYIIEKIKSHPNDLIKRSPNFEMLISQVKELIMAISSHFNEKNPQNNINLIEVAKSIIERTFDNDLTLDQVAKYVHLNSTYLSELFKKETRMSFIDYKTHVRIDYAKKLLDTTDMNSNEISFKIGYSDPKYFSKLFKKTTGLTVNEYRKNRTL